MSSATPSRQAVGTRPSQEVTRFPSLVQGEAMPIVESFQFSQ